MKLRTASAWLAFGIAGICGLGAQTAPTADSYLEASFQAYQQGKFSESITAAREALKAHPDLALAWNNIAASYNALGLFDDGLRAAQEAIRLQPDFPLAKNNLEWARLNLDTESGRLHHQIVGLFPAGQVRRFAQSRAGGASPAPQLRRSLEQHRGGR